MAAAPPARGSYFSHAGIASTPTRSKPGVRVWTKALSQWQQQSLVGPALWPSRIAPPLARRGAAASVLVSPSGRAGDSSQERFVSIEQVLQDATAEDNDLVFSGEQVKESQGGNDMYERLESSSSPSADEDGQHQQPRVFPTSDAMEKVLSAYSEAQPNSSLEGGGNESQRI